MSLSGSIGLANNSLKANQIALQVVGQNIANANTPGYIREEVVLTPATCYRSGRLLLGLGVTVEAVVQKIDHFLEERLRGSVSDQFDAETREDVYLQLEGIIGELSDTDLSTSINEFFDSISEILSAESQVPPRNMAVLRGSTLADDIRRLANRVAEIRSELNDRVIEMNEDINRLIEEVRVLNVRIANVEGGDISQSDAVGLRDQRLLALDDLARLIDIRVREQESGGVVIYTGGEALLFGGISRQVEVSLKSDRGMSAADIHLVDTDSPLNPASGELAGLLASRDEILGGFLDRLDEFARTFIFEFNKVHSQGQGLNWFEEVTSEFAVDGTDLVLNQAGLEFVPDNGLFQVVVHNTNTDVTKTTDVRVDLNGLGADTTVADLVAALNAVSGISASITAEGKLKVSGDSADQEFTFADDTSGVLAAFGLNTFFAGSTATDMGVNDLLKVDPMKFAASRMTGTGDYTPNTENAVLLAAFHSHPIESQNNASLDALYDRMIGETTQASTAARSVAEGARVFEATLRGQKLATSGVNLDEEALRMITFQRAYEVNARYIRTLTDLLEVLVNL